MSPSKSKLMFYKNIFFSNIYENIGKTNIGR